MKLEITLFFSASFSSEMAEVPSQSESRPSTVWVASRIDRLASHFMLFWVSSKQCRQSSMKTMIYKLHWNNKTKWYCYFITDWIKLIFNKCKRKYLTGCQYIDNSPLNSDWHHINVTSILSFIVTVYGQWTDIRSQNIIYGLFTAFISNSFWPLKLALGQNYQTFSRFI